MTKHEAHGYKPKLKSHSDVCCDRSELLRVLPKPLSLKVRRLTPDAILPTKAHPTDSGFDLYAAEDVVLAPGETVVIKTGIAIELPAGYEATIRPRSGITAKTKLRVQLGTIDTSYRGELSIITDNVYRRGRNPRPFTYDVAGKAEKIDYSTVEEGTYVIRKGDRIAQLVVTQLPQFEAVEVSEFMYETTRGTAGFGSSGVRQ